MRTLRCIALTFLALMLTALAPVSAVPGYHINSDKAARAAVTSLFTLTME